ERDVIEQRPDVLSVSIGVNDVWHGLMDGHEGCDIDRFTAGYRSVVGRTRRALPACKVVLCDPSSLWLTQPSDADARLKPYIEAIHRLGGEFGVACVVGLHAAFARARAAREDVAWTTDGVHPTSAGHAL